MMKKRCAYLTMECTDGWSIDAELGFVPMEALGWQVDAVSWRTETPDWGDYDAVYIGVPWDYPEDPEHFLSVLQSIDESSAILVNDLELVHWALPKTYLRDLEERGAAIVPSTMHEEMGGELLEQAFDTHKTDRIIVKPVVSTNATDTYLLTLERARELEAELASVFCGRPFMVQPFIENIQSEGEFSLFYFNCEFSHATLKVPKPAMRATRARFSAVNTSSTASTTTRLSSVPKVRRVWSRNSWPSSPAGTRPSADGSSCRRRDSGRLLPRHRFSV